VGAGVAPGGGCAFPEFWIMEFRAQVPLRVGVYLWCGERWRDSQWQGGESPH